MTLFDKLYKEFVFGGHFQSLGAASLVFVTFLIFGWQVSWSAVILAYFLFYPLYLFNRLWEIDNDAVSNPERSEYFRQYNKKLIFVFIVETVLTVFLLLFLSPNVQVIIYGGFLYTLGILYTIFVKKLTRFIFALKNFYVAAFFAGLVPFSALFVNSTFNRQIWWLTVFLFLKGVLMQILLDIKDYNTDKKDGLKTFVAVWGKKRSLSFSLFFSFFVAILLPWYLSVYKVYFPVWFLFTFFILPFYILIINLIKNNKYTGYVLASGEYLFWVILLLFGKIIL